MLVDINRIATMSPDELGTVVDGISRAGKLEHQDNGKLEVTPRSLSGTVYSVFSAVSEMFGWSESNYDKNLAEDLRVVLMNAEKQGLADTHRAQIERIHGMLHRILSKEPSDWSVQGGMRNWQDMPPEILKLQFQKLEPKELVQCAKVNPTWNAWASEVLLKRCQQRFPDSIFGRDEWLAYAGDPGEVPAPPNAALAELLTCEDSDNPPFLHWMPKTVDGKPWTLRALESCANKEGSEVSVPVDVQKSINNEYGDDTVDNACWVIMDRRLSKESVGEGAKKNFQRAERDGGELPKTIVTATILHTCLVRNGKHELVQDVPPQAQNYRFYARCAEMVHGDLSISVGTTSLSSPVISVEMGKRQELIGVLRSRNFLSSD
jgi:hypothetical protein